MRRRKTRHWLTDHVMWAAQYRARQLPGPVITAAERLVARGGPLVPVLSRIVADNLHAAGVFDHGVVPAYFAQVARHLANALRILRCGEDPAALQRLADGEIQLDSSVRVVHDVLALGRGAILAPAHVCNYLLTLIRLNRDFPICVYLRWSKDARKREMKQAWCRAAGLRAIVEPSSAADPTSRARMCIEALRGGAALVMTPDLVQKLGRGVEVDVFGRSVCLPTGPASIAMLGETPLVPMFGRVAGGTHTIYAREPVPVASLPRRDGGRPEAIRRAMQAWCCAFEEYVRACPAAWYFWADKRWTKVFRDDPEYTRKTTAPSGDRGAPAPGGDHGAPAPGVAFTTGVAADPTLGHTPRPDTTRTSATTGHTP